MTETHRPAPKQARSVARLAAVQALLPAARARALETRGAIRFIGHQANLLMLDAVARRIEVDTHWHNVESFGNTGAAGAPTVLSQRWDELAEGDVVVLAVVGSGLTWASVQIEIGG